MRKPGIAASMPRKDVIQGLISLFQSGRLRDAETQAKSLIKQFPQALVLFDILSASLSGQGKLDEALASGNQALKIKPDYVQAHNNVGLILQKLGRLDEAVASYERALEIQPDYADAHTNLGAVLRRQGKLREAVSSCRSALKHQPRHVLAHCNLGIALKDLGELEEAIDSFRRALKINPKLAEALNNLGNALQELGRTEEAIANYRRAVRVRPAYDEAHTNLGTALHKSGASEEAVACYRQALEINPESVNALLGLAEALSRAGHLEQIAGLEDLILRCLHSPEISSRLVRSASQFALKSKLRSFQASGAFSPDDLAGLDPSTNGLLTAHLKHTLIADAELESFLCRVRNSFLAFRGEVNADALKTGPVLRLLEALAYQGFLNEYVWYVGEDENSSLDALEAALARSIEDGETPDEFDLYLLAAYRPLYSIERIRRWGLEASGDAGAGLDGFLETAIRAPDMEQQIRQQMEKLTSIEDSVSAAVRSQYEENPYPRWDSLSVGRPRPYTEHILSAIAPHRPVLEPGSPAPDVLIAGCGTGQQPLSCALGYLNSNILAVDLSTTSLAFAKRKAEELAVPNIRFAQADILKLGDLEDSFDVIECLGVLHHMADPEAGLKVLLQRLKPGGYLKLGLYSELARQDVVGLRQLVSEKGFEPTLEGIREFRRYARESENPHAAALADSGDYYATSAIRDLVFHVQEHRFTIPGISKLLDDHALEFFGFTIENPLAKISYAKQYGDDADALNLENWDKFEQANPTTFGGMYQFWCRWTG